MRAAPIAAYLSASCRGRLSPPRLPSPVRWLSFSAFARKSVRFSPRPVSGSAPQPEEAEGQQGRRRQAEEDGVQAEQRLYEEELSRLYAAAASAAPAAAQLGREQDDDGDEDAAVLGFFDAAEPDGASDADVLRLSAVSGSARGLLVSRLLRLKRAVREVLTEVLSSRAELRSLPLHCHSTRVSSDLQWVTVLWRLRPVHPASSLVRLPASLSQHASLTSLLPAVSAALSACIGPARRLLAERVRLRTVPVLRFAYDDSQRQQTRQDARTADSIRRRLGDSSAAALTEPTEEAAQWERLLCEAPPSQAQQRRRRDAATAGQRSARGPQGARKRRPAAGQRRRRQRQRETESVEQTVARLRKSRES